MSFVFNQNPRLAKRVSTFINALTFLLTRGDYDNISTFIADYQSLRPLPHASSQRMLYIFFTAVRIFLKPCFHSQNIRVLTDNHAAITFPPTFHGMLPL